MAYKPRKGSNYWMVNSRFEIKQTFNSGKERSQKRIDVGNCFKTAKEARQFRSTIMGIAIDMQKVDFDKRIAFVYGLVTGAFVVGILWLI